MVPLIVAFIILVSQDVSGQSTFGDNPGAILQGGDNIANAYVISALPFSDTGTTAGYIDDYTGTCGINGGAPDVVYSYYAAYDDYMTISLCQETNFDSRLYVFEDSQYDEFACNDDYCENQYSDYVSSLECLQLNGGHTYYIVIDGYNGAYGRYSIDIMPPIPGIPFYGIVSESGGGPLSGATVRVLEGGNPVWADTTDSYGMYEVIFLPDGSYFVEASKANFITQTSGPYVVNACRVNVVDFVLEPAGPPPIGSIVGIVTDSILGIPLQGALVRALDGGYERGSDSTDISGHYAINELQIVPHDIEASLSGYVAKYIPGVQVVADDSVRLDIALANTTQPCDLTPPPGAIIEGEPDCYDDFEDIFNGGCHNNTWDTIPSSCVFFGGGGTYLYQSLQDHDTDWLAFELEDSSQVILQGTAEYDLSLMIIRQGRDIPCNGFEVLSFAEAYACTSASINRDLPAGRYWVWTAPADFAGVECGSDYMLTLTSTTIGACVYIPGDIGGNGSVNGIDVVFGVNYLKGGIPPTTQCDMCPQPIPFYAAGDVNGSCAFNGIDITFFVNYLKGSVPDLLFCPSCPPGEEP